MVTQWGYSETLGPIRFAERTRRSFLGRSVSKTTHISEETARIIDQEVNKIVTRNYQRARQILEENMDILHAMKDV